MSRRDENEAFQQSSFLYGGNAAYLENIGHAVAGQYGTLTLHTDGTYTYQANPNVSGDDVFHYTVMDNDGDTSTATLTITVTNGQPTVAAARGAEP